MISGGNRWRLYVFMSQYYQSCYIICQYPAEARILVLAIDDVEISVSTAALLREHFPALRIFARARNRKHAYRQMDLGVQVIQRETLLSAADLADK